ncbi:hypothetical protein NQ314_009178 [Rhamnusium bicolor]|uniref:VWFA domain-containing protein n=1 Tax=Rhamnusium bicolor TaxID=1586634 RepID=A0AAV8Y5X5_9CUCU|nr:hypothetical protein NQ314_009178 [Rhamnusium bicolor]
MNYEISVDNSARLKNRETTNNELVEVFSENSDSTGTNVQFERIKNVSNNSTKKYETVRKFVKHYNSLRPVAVLVDDTKETNVAAKHFMKTVFEVTPNAKYIHFFMFKFNTSGVSPTLEVIGNNTNKIDKLLSSTSENELSYLGPTGSNGTVAFFAILNAAAVLPQNSAILIFIDRKIADEDLASHTGILEDKNIKASYFYVYAIWGGSYPTKFGEERLLRELCAYSGGLFLVNTSKNLASYNYRLFLENGNTHLNTSIILSKNNLLGPSDFTFPIDSKVTGIHISISPFISIATLSAPNGYIIDILKNDEIAEYSTGSFGVTEPGLHEVHLNITTAPTHNVGFWRLKLNNVRALYNVTVFVYSKLSTHAYFIKNTSSQSSTGNVKKIMKLGISGYITSINNISFVDKDGQAILDNVEYTLVKDWKFISPEETAIVRVTLTTRYGSYQDEVTFSATIGSEAFTKKVTVDIGTQMAYDNIEPELDYTYSSDCSKVVFSNCADGTWTIKIKARDSGSVTTDPRGIYFPYGFTTGTKEEVVGYYSDSCCNPDLQIIAVDRLNNRKVRNVNAYLAFWGPAQIAALVLGILLLILIIVLIVYLIVKCVKEEKIMTFQLTEVAEYDS